MSFEVPPFHPWVIIYLIIKTITVQRWKGGITNDKNYFSVKNRWKYVNLCEKVAFLC